VKLKTKTEVTITLTGVEATDLAITLYQASKRDDLKFTQAAAELLA
jgi:hypothetical protein